MPGHSDPGFDTLALHAGAAPDDRAGYGPGRDRSESRGDRYLRLDRDLEPGMCVTIEPGFYQIPAVLADPTQIHQVFMNLADGGRPQSPENVENLNYLQCAWAYAAEGISSRGCSAQRR